MIHVLDPSFEGLEVDEAEKQELHFSFGVSADKAVIWKVVGEKNS